MSAKDYADAVRKYLTYHPSADAALNMLEADADELDALRALNAEAMEMLRRLEWHKHYEDVQICQVCGGIKSMGGHRLTCGLNALLQNKKG